MLRISKILIVLAVAAFFTITVFNNIIDYEKTFTFIKHTLSMDTTAQNSHFMNRAILDPMIQHAAFVFIIIFQGIIALLCWIGAFNMMKHLCYDSSHFSTSKQIAILGCSLGFMLYALGFLVIAGQWFMMRESIAWNVQNSVHMFLTFLGVSMIYLCLVDE